VCQLFYEKKAHSKAFATKQPRQCVAVQKPDSFFSNVPLERS
jgi:hypothetical protein